jgi:hypothetical protein
MTQLDTSSLHIAVFDKANAASGNGLRGEVAFGAGSGIGCARAHGGV